MSPVALRAAVPADARAVRGLIRRGDDTYSDWAAPGWRLPLEASLADDVAVRRALRPQSDSFSTLAVEDGEAAGFVSCAPAPEQPGRASLTYLYVDPPRWGRGIARALLAAAVRRMAALGYEGARLRTPSGNERARRLCERAGWVELPGSARFSDGLGLEMVEYRLALEPPQTAHFP